MNPPKKSRTAIWRNHHLQHFYTSVTSWTSWICWFTGLALQRPHRGQHGQTSCHPPVWPTGWPPGWIFTDGVGPPGWWLNQPLWKICSSNLEIISPSFRVKIKDIWVATTQLWWNTGCFKMGSWNIMAYFEAPLCGLSSRIYPKPLGALFHLGRNNRKNTHTN